MIGSFQDRSHVYNNELIDKTIQKIHFLKNESSCKKTLRRNELRDQS